MYCCYLFYFIRFLFFTVCLLYVIARMNMYVMFLLRQRRLNKLIIIIIQNHKNHSKFGETNWVPCKGYHTSSIGRWWPEWHRIPTHTAPLKLDSSTWNKPQTLLDCIKRIIVLRWRHERINWWIQAL